MKEIYRDGKRQISVEGIRLEVKGKFDKEIELVGAEITTDIPEIIKNMLKEIGDTEEKCILYTACQKPVVIPLAAMAVIQAEITAIKAKNEALRNQPENIERRAIDALYSKADRLAESDSEDNVAGPMSIRAEAHRRLINWRMRYPECAKKEDKNNLLALASEQEHLATGALTFDADGWLDNNAQQKRHDEFIRKAEEYKEQAAKI